MRVSFQELLTVLTDVLSRAGFSGERAEASARLFAETTLDGVASHGLYRLPKFLRGIERGLVDIYAEPALVASSGAIERWNGNRGVGNLNARHSMGRAVELARSNGIGCVALANTNHWMRGGTYGWQAADAGMIGICWTNTLPNMPPWGGKKPGLGNNPLVIAVPRRAGHVVLDMAMSQFSFGALESYRKRSELLPVDGGYDQDGELTKDAAAIEATRRPLPIGFWKGSGLSLVLDLVAASLSGGLATHQIPPDPELRTCVSQIFIAIAPASLGNDEMISGLVDSVISDLKLPEADGLKIRYPGESVLRTRQENLAAGIPVDEHVWNEVKSLTGRTA